ncbi:MAG: DUF6491 family protein [Woeseiaceae bacterium]
MRSRTTRALTALTTIILAACASQEEQETQDTEQAVRDFIAVRGLPEGDRIRTDGTDSWEKIDQNFIIYEKRKEAFLIEFARRCNELDEVPVVPDVRHGNEIRPRFDTLRGCRIAKLYPLNEAEVIELKDIGEAPGSRN